jgi:hypothetical protein
MSEKFIERQRALKGSLCVRVERCGEAARGERVGNLIVTRGRANLAALLAGESGLHATHVGVGSGNVPASSMDVALSEPELSEISEARVGVGLEAEDGSLFNDPKIVQFHFSFGTDAAVGKTIWEYGLICADGSLFSRIVRPSGFVKTEYDRIFGYWQIQF